MVEFRVRVWVRVEVGARGLPLGLARGSCSIEPQVGSRVHMHVLPFLMAP